jgi:hypothetical protein
MINQNNITNKGSMTQALGLDLQIIGNIALILPIKALWFLLQYTERLTKTITINCSCGQFGQILIWENQCLMEVCVQQLNLVKYTATGQSNYGEGL